MLWSLTYGYFLNGTVYSIIMLFDEFHFLNIKLLLSKNIQFDAAADI